jgi:hypothetical protein
MELSSRVAQYMGKNTVAGINLDLEAIRTLLRNHDQRLEVIEKRLNRVSEED